jgi:hypothetical protein
MSAAEGPGTPNVVRGGNPRRLNGNPRPLNGNPGPLDGDPGPLNESGFTGFAQDAPRLLGSGYEKMATCR